ncbi:sulfate transporter, partial [Trifolium medium]|nr:sulfate transporter [Trifolium medium]
MRALKNWPLFLWELTKVLIRSSSDAEVRHLMDGAKDFFSLFFSNWVSWNKEAGSSQRGAWVRLYGIQIHAWNENFFKLWVLDCGRYLRADSCTMEKDKLDYARILIATPALEIVQSVEKLLVDGELIEVKIIEEWGLSLGEDACLFDDEPDSEMY